MVTFLITSVLVLGIIAIAIYFWQKPAHKSEPIELPPPRSAGLFTEETQTENPELSEVRLLTPAPKEPPETEADGRVSKEEVNAFIRSWQAFPDRKSTAEMIHMAAAADDADTYCQAIEVALSTWERGSIPGLSAAELQNLFTSGFWLLSSRTRSSGAGFVLKQTLSRASRELERANNQSDPSTASS